MHKILIKDVMDPLRPGSRRPKMDGRTSMVAAKEPLDVLFAMRDLDLRLSAGLWVTDEGRVVGRLRGATIVRWLTTHAQELADERDAARRGLATVRDQRSRLIANLAHELRTPLNAIIGYSDLICAEVMGPIAPAAYREHVEAIFESGGHMLSVLESILSLARINAGEMALTETDCDIGDLVNGAFRIVHGLAERRQVTLTSIVDKRVPKVHADARLLKQILINLLSNSLKASPPETTVTVQAVLTRDKCLRLSVQDQGPGIPPDKIEMMMRPFKQMERDERIESTGTGLGLPLVKAMVELHDGQFQLMSSAPQGALAVVTLPSARVRTPKHLGSQGEFEFTRVSTEMCG